ncbi:MAG TPA: PH domain-containing protein [Clostridia bacterium]|nr:PH domain-containing protein [Clostridia bacterium]
MGLVSSLMGNAGAVEPSMLQEQYGKLFTEGEEAELGFKLVRDVFIFTNRRLILVDVQGLTGKKTSYLSVGYKSISRFSLETSGHLDLDAELKIWLSGEDSPTIDKQFNKKVDVYGLQKLLASHVMG